MVPKTVATPGLIRGRGPRPLAVGGTRSEATKVWGTR